MFWKAFTAVMVIFFVEVDGVDVIKAGATICRQSAGSQKLYTENSLPKSNEGVLLLPDHSQPRLTKAIPGMLLEQNLGQWMLELRRLLHTAYIT